MKSLQQLYTDLLKPNTSNSCHYYPINLAIENVENVSAKEFIRGYFREGGKKNLITVVEDAFGIELSEDRYEHMRSVFLLGIVLYNKISLIKDGINKTIEFITKLYISECKSINTSPKICTDNRKCFLYMWYLICLYHDFGYIYENDKYEKNNYKLTIKKEEIRQKIESGTYFIESEQDVVNIPSFLRQVSPFYFRLRAFCPLFSSSNRSCLDHGLVSGTFMYETLNHLHSNEDIKKDNDYNLYFGKPIFNHYVVPAVWTIICHNIWFAERDTPSDNKYLNFGLGELTYTKGNSPINMREYPLLFLLCLVDTIEPLKKYMKENYNDNVGSNGESVTANNNDNTRKPEDILSSVTASFTNNKLRFMISPPLPSSACRSKCEYHKDTKKCTRYSCHKSIQRGLSFLESPLFQVSVDDQYLNLTFTDL